MLIRRTRLRLDERALHSSPVNISPKQDTPLLPPSQLAGAPSKGCRRSQRMTRANM